MFSFLQENNPKHTDLCMFLNGSAKVQAKTQVRICDQDRKIKFSLNLTEIFCKDVCRNVGFWMSETINLDDFSFSS